MTGGGELLRGCAWLALCWLAGCAPRAHLVVLESPDLRLPSTVRSVSVVSAVQPTEGPERAGIELTLSGIDQLLQRSHRVRPVRSSAQPPIDPVQVCVDDGTDAVIVLDAFRSEENTELWRRDEAVVSDDGEPGSVLRVTAARSSRVFTSWRLIDREGNQLDELQDVFTVARWASEEDSDASAEAALPSAEEAIAELGFSAGVAYGKRIAPIIGDEQRTYFVRGDVRFVWARRAVRVGDWQSAGALWRQISVDPTVSGVVHSRALANLALMHEVHGDYPLALRQIELALAAHDSERIQRYRGVLREQQTRQRDLRRPVPSEEAGSP